MSMLKSITLENYKCFKDKTKIDIAPLTILCGGNSSGKSSIFKSLLLLKQSYENSSSTNELTLNGTYTMNGTMKDLLFNHRGNEFTLDNCFRLYFYSANYKGQAKQDLASAKEIGKILNMKVNEVSYFDMEISCTIHKGSTNDSNYISKYFIKVSPFDKNTKLASNKVFSVMLSYRRKGKYTIELINFPTTSKESISYIFDNCSCYFSGLRLTNLYYESKNKDILLQDFLVNLYAVCRIASNQYAGIKYLGPLRENPDRQYAIYKNTIASIVTGANAPYLLYKEKNKKVDKKILPPSDENNFFAKQSNKSNIILDIVNAWMQYLELGNIEIKNDENTMQLYVSGSNISDVGVGVSQALPILTEGITMNYEQTFLVEQPEIHLHPKMQMRIADFFITLASTNHNVIVETHSDHIINRILRRTLECEDNSLWSKVSIYFLENTNQGSSIEQIMIDRVLGITKAPDDFFGQFATETSNIVDAGLGNMKRGNK